MEERYEETLQRQRENIITFLAYYECQCSDGTPWMRNVKTTEDPPPSICEKCHAACDASVLLENQVFPLEPQGTEDEQGQPQEEEMAEQASSLPLEKDKPWQAPTVDPVQWPLPSPLASKPSRVSKETVTFDLTTGGEADGEVEDFLTEEGEEYLSLPPRPTDSLQTSLHSFMAAVPGTKSEVAGSKGRYRKARLADVDVPKRDRSRSPVPSSSEEEKEVVKQSKEEGSSDGDFAASGFGAAKVVQKLA